MRRDLSQEFWNGKRVLVGGGCGFLGSYVTPELVDAGAVVTVVDDLSNGTAEHLDVGRGDVRLIVGNLADPDVAAEVTAGQDIFVNLAARAFGMEYSSGHDGEMLVSNLLCTLVPLEAARIAGIQRVMVVSTSCVYPDDAPAPTPELPTFTKLPESVNEGYGWAKRIQELAGMYYARDYGMTVTIVRPFNPYGGNYRWGSEDKAHVIPALVKRILDGEDPVVVWGSGRQQRNFLHARDAARLMMLVLEAGVSGEPVNIGFEQTTTIRELAELICDVAGVSPEIIFDTSKPEGRFRKAADSRRLRAIAGGYEPTVPLRDGIIEMVRWYAQSFSGHPSNAPVPP